VDFLTGAVAWIPTLILGLLMFTAIIAVHEFGHYLTARLLGMKVLEFAFGFPPRLFAIRHAGIDYSINAIPFGGFVRILGQDDFTIHQAGEGDPGSFTSKPWWAQAIVLAAGVAMNMVLALFVLTIAFATGTTAATGDVRVTEVIPDSPAQRAGIQVGDIVRAIDGRPITRSNELVSYVKKEARLHPDREVTLEIERGGRLLPPVKAVPRVDPPERQGPLGITLEEVQGTRTLSVPEAFNEAVSLSGQVVGQIAELPGQLLAPRASGGGPTVGGPIEILRVTGQVAQYGLPALLKLVGVLSVNLAVLNIVPFPGLDGGRLLFVLIGGIFRRRISPQVEAAIHAVGFVLLLALLVVISIADIRRVVGG
jgi:regulator of sigma E protease